MLATPTVVSREWKEGRNALARKPTIWQASVRRSNHGKLSLALILLAGNRRCRFYCIEVDHGRLPTAGSQRNYHLGQIANTFPFSLSVGGEARLQPSTNERHLLPLSQTIAFSCISCEQGREL
mmetsp:Transcript_1720/g.10611  ORF Transcript_1720/g.10611 Transcript_1720/m.10611 type:complete len:123 (+) Transcript_1720:243-611(+)